MLILVNMVNHGEHYIVLDMHARLRLHACVSTTFARTHKVFPFEPNWVYVRSKKKLETYQLYLNYSFNQQYCAKAQTDASFTSSLLAS